MPGGACQEMLIAHIYNIFIHTYKDVSSVLVFCFPPLGARRSLGPKQPGPVQLAPLETQAVRS